MPDLHPLIRSLPHLSPELTQFLESSPAPDLQGKKGSSTIRSALVSLPNFESLSPKSKAGLWLLVGELDRSHTISQEIDDVDGSYWHAIMHRREGDFWNSKYWFRRCQKHSILRSLGADVAGNSRLDSDLRKALVRQGTFLPEAFVDACESYSRQPMSDPGELIEVAWLEWQHLFANCYLSE